MMQFGVPLPTFRQAASPDAIRRVPDSGTDELAGIAGAMTIIIEGSKHSYEFEYTLGGK
ncbi:MAG: DUF3224 domain-containing protein [Blastocatellia bacterium]